MNIDTAPQKGLWQQAFGDPPEFIDGFFRTGFSPDRCCCLQEQGQLAAALYWFDCRWDRKRLAYIYAVATEETLRGQGLCRRLMEQTHEHLARLGYAGAVLVPAEPGLFQMYEKMGYRGFCPMKKIQVLPGKDPVQLQPLSPEDYGAQRLYYLPPEGIVQQGKTLAFLATYAGFYAFQGGVFCAAREGETLHIQEFFGAADRLPGIVRALGAAEAKVRLPGGDQPFAMYRSLTEDDRLPGYFGIALD